MKAMIFVSSQEAFKNAINAGFLTADSTGKMYAGDYMYMYTMEDVNYFKHINTRAYVSFINI